MSYPQRGNRDEVRSSHEQINPGIFCHRHMSMDMTTEEKK